MKTHIYSIMRNEEELLPYFLRHYSAFADKIFIIDNGSTDNTVKIAKTNKKVHLLKYKFTPGWPVEAEHNACFEKLYKKYSRGEADWVMCVDGDEFIYNRYLIKVLQEHKKRGTKAIKTCGYTMYSEKFPTTKGQIYDECKFGARTRLFDKTVVFNPAINVKFGRGRHETILPKGVAWVRAKVLLLHYRYLSLESALKRLLHYPPLGYDPLLIKNLRIALDRYEYGVLMIRKGSLIKLV